MGRTLQGFFAALSLAVLGFSAEPDFTGTWRLDSERSEIRALPTQPAQLLRITHAGTTIRCEAKVNDTEPARECSCTTDGKESRAKYGSRSLSTVSKWEGAALLRNTLVRAKDGQHTEMDRWKLSRDRNTLSIRRTIISLQGEMESTLVYNRQPEMKPLP